FVSVFLHKLKVQKQRLVQQKENARDELKRLRTIVVVNKPPQSKPGPDPVDVNTDPSANKGTGPPPLLSETPPDARTKGASDGFPYKLSMDPYFIAAVLVSMAYPTGVVPSASLPLTLYSPSEAPMAEKDYCDHDPNGQPAKLIRRSSASVSSDPAGASAGSGDAANVKRKKRSRRDDGAAPDPAGRPQAAATVAPPLPVGPGGSKPRSEMAQSDLML
ncbi:hypothetical protein PFISCL1PPCAC_6811, partial [Pristionchus fissidentatus]